jgi:ATP-dependent DNA helicase RecG
MFTQMGRAEEIGSGVVNVNRYLKHYIAGAKKPLFLDGVVFKTTVPLGEHLLVDAEKQSGEKAENGGVNDFAGMSAGVKTVYELIKEVIAKLPKFSVKGVWLPLLDMLCRVETP